MTTTASIATDVRHILLNVAQEGQPLTVEHDGQQALVTGVRFTYTNGTVTAIRIVTADDTLFVDAADIADPDSWIPWLRMLADAYRPLPNHEELEALDSIMKGDNYSASGLIHNLDEKQRHDLANNLDVYQTLLNRIIEAHG
ncbi:hypothetical protein [Streptomyces sp. NPDC059071]|uniref:hypothetical protein n=1 Tax=unclassified Streptomyces TaxID=2593676 RepID=UPI00366041C4